MKTALFQSNPICGDPRGNAKQLLRLAREAAAQGARLCLSPAQALSGPKPGAFARDPGFALAREQALCQLAAALAQGPDLIVGDADEAFLLASGKACRVMQQDNPVLLELAGMTLGLLRGLEPWPLELKKPNLVLRLGEMPFAPGAAERLEDRLSQLARQSGVCQLLANLAGGDDGSIFPGLSMAVDASGKLIARGSIFAQDVVVADCGADEGSIAPLPACAEEELYGALVLGLGDFARKCGVPRALLGLSGGLDSALVGCIACSALGPENVLGLLMPSPYTSKASLEDARSLARNLGMPSVTLPILPLMRAYAEVMAPALALLPPGADHMEENVQARARGTLLANLANRARALVLNTGNKSELAMGYCTLYGDAVGALGVLADLTKTQVRALAAWINSRGPEEIIPRRILERPPSAELAPDQKDEDSLPPYQELDPALDEFLRRPDNPNTLFAARTPGSPRERLYASEFKRRQAPPALVVSDCPLGANWRVPVAGRCAPPGPER